ncbi:MAG: metallophosphoesterase [Frankiaceae bacterium]|nr:metallophosphoesterase [Frankiaceae bacterium]
MWSRRVLLAAELAAVGLLGAILGLLVAGTVSAPVGPFTADLSLRPALSGTTVVAVPPLGELQLDTHDGPVKLQVRIAQLRDDAARSIVADPARLEGLGDQVNADLRKGVVELVLRTLLVTVAGAALLGLLVFRRWRATLAAAGAGFVALLLAAGVTAATADERALAEPRYTGLLASAPTAIGDVRDVVARFDAYQLQLGRLVANVSELYAVTSELPVFTAGDDNLRVLHVSDLHLNPGAFGVIRSVVDQFGIDVVLDTGDSTDFGSTAENRFLGSMSRVGAPYVWVRGNHDSSATQAAAEQLEGVTVLDGGEVVEVAGVRLMGQGDPRFTPDKSTRDDDAPTSVLTAVGNALKEAYEQADEKPAVVLVHDPLSAGPLVGTAPLVLAGHAHQRRVEAEDGTTLMVQGSTGGAGLRALEGEEPTPIMLTVLYLDRASGELQAYDEITLGGLGDNEVRIARRLASQEPRPEPSPTPAPTPSTTPTPSATARPSPSPTPRAG